MRGPDQKTVRNARRLWRQSTAAETKLWLTLRDRRPGGFKFVRQEAVGPYIVDFLCREQMLAVEVDGGQHGENATGAMRRNISPQ
jgi:very-short-patch-repair endonuclease